MAKDILSVGTRVRQRGKEHEGLVSYDTFGLCNGGEVWVVWDGSLNACAVRVENLENLGKIDFQVDHQKCRDCVFYRGSDCMRCMRGWDLLLHSNGKKIIPDRIYPYCQSQCQSLVKGQP